MTTEQKPRNPTTADGKTFKMLAVEGLLHISGMNH